MTTGDINEVFQMKTSAPSRFLRSDKEILEYIKFCINISEISAEINGRGTGQWKNLNRVRFVAVRRT